MKSPCSQCKKPTIGIAETVLNGKIQRLPLCPVCLDKMERDWKDVHKGKEK